MEIFTFIQHQWVLVTLLVLFILAFIGLEIWQQFKGPKRLSPVLVTQFMNTRDPVIFDIRDKNKFLAGHLLHAQSVPQNEAEKMLKTLKKSHEAPILLVCQTGQQSLILGARLKKQGFTEVACLAGGMNAWQNADYPIEKRSS